MAKSTACHLQKAEALQKRARQRCWTSASLSLGEWRNSINVSFSNTVSPFLLQVSIALKTEFDAPSLTRRVLTSASHVSRSPSQSLSFVEGQTDLSIHKMEVLIQTQPCQHAQSEKQSAVLTKKTKTLSRQKLQQHRLSPKPCAKWISLQEVVLAEYTRHIGRVRFCSSYQNRKGIQKIVRCIRAWFLRIARKQTTKL